MAARERIAPVQRAPDRAAGARSGTAPGLLHMQRTAGNRAVGRLLSDRRLQRVVGPTLAIGTPVWIWIDPHTRVRGRTTSVHDPLHNAYTVIEEEDSGAGVGLPPRPYRMTVDRLDPMGEAPDHPPAPAEHASRPATRGLRVVVIGGGPTGLLAAIEAVLNGAAHVTVFEGREADYSRRNVPTLTKETLAKLQRAGVYDELFESWGSPGVIKEEKGQVPIRHLEEALARRARRLGIEIVRGSRPKAIQPGAEKKGSRPATATLDVTGTVTEFRSEEVGQTSRVWAEQVPRPQEQADLVIVATGAGASRDPFVTETLGIEYKQLTATDYGIYGLFEHAATTPYELGHYVKAFKRMTGMLPARKPETPEHRSGVRNILETGPTLTSFETPGHDYILGFLSGLSPDDFAQLQVRADDPEEVKERKRQNLRRLAEHVATRMTAGLGEKYEKLLPDAKAVEVFEVRLAQALNLVSPHYPAVVIGDAAATPHPQTGSGLNTGAASLDALGALVRDLVADKPADEAFALYQTTVGSITTIMILKALFAMATAFKYKVKQLFPPELVRVWGLAFKRTYGAEWTPWFEERIALTLRILNTARENEEAGHPDHTALDIAWKCLDEIYEVVQKAYQGNAQIEEKLTALDAQL